LSQNRPNDACDAIEAVFSRVITLLDQDQSKPIIQTLQNTSGSMEGNDDNEEDESMAQKPSPEFCVSTSKMMIECADTRSKLAQSAGDLLSRLVNEDEDNIELWYLMGVASFSCKPRDDDGAREYFNKAKTMVEALQKLPGANKAPADVKLQLKQQKQLIDDSLLALDEPCPDDEAQNDDCESDNEDMLVDEEYE
jgi:hypothetical protein